METNKKKPKAVVVGGSIAGLSSAHSLLAAGWDVVVLEKSGVSPTGTSAGAGLALDALSCRILESWLRPPTALHGATVPLTNDLNRVTYKEKNTCKVLTSDETFNYRAVHWADLHALLRTALPPNIFLWRHLFLSFDTFVHAERTLVSVRAKVLGTGEVIEVTGDLLVAADDSLSSVRQTVLPQVRLRYAGYCAWRGVIDLSGKEDSETSRGLRKAYPDLGKVLYFDLAPNTHMVLYELLNKRINWLWYVNQPEPHLEVVSDSVGHVKSILKIFANQTPASQKPTNQNSTSGNSVTIKVNREMIAKMHEEAERVWNPELAKLIRGTEDPFLNVIYDTDPLERVFWGNVVLVGDAAHPTTPHCPRSTNMSILDAAVLGKCLEKWGVEKLQFALGEYESTRLPVVSSQVLHARRLGRIKQGLEVDGFRGGFDPTEASEECCEILQQRKAPFFDHVPSIMKEFKCSALSNNLRRTNFRCALFPFMCFN